MKTKLERMMAFALVFGAFGVNATSFAAEPNEPASVSTYCRPVTVGLYQFDMKLDENQRVVQEKDFIARVSTHDQKDVTLRDLKVQKLQQKLLEKTTSAHPMSPYSNVHRLYAVKMKISSSDQIGYDHRGCILTPSYEETAWALCTETESFRK
jgi:hypothetical protein